MIFLPWALGVDPGYRNLGLGLIRRDAPSEPWRAVHVQTVRTSSKLSFHERSGVIYDALESAVGQRLGIYSGVIGCESQIAAEGKRQRGQTSYEAMLVQQIVGIVRAIALRHCMRFEEVPVTDVKAVLRGIPRTASKTQVARATRAVIRDCPEKMSSHATDALATALAAARRCVR